MGCWLKDVSFSGDICDFFIVDMPAVEETLETLP
jgi:hypothetical protein